MLRPPPRSTLFPYTTLFRSLSSQTSSAFNIAAGTATQLVFSVQPTNTVAGAAITPAIQVTAQDGSGNTATGFTGNITLAIGTNPGSGTLAGTLTHAAVGGVATFSGLSIDKAGTGYTLTATGAGSTTSTAFNVTAGPAGTLVFTVQPTSTVAGASITPAVEVTARDVNGNTATGFTGNVTLAIGTNASGGTLAGTATHAAVGGVATFAGLSIDKVGTGYTLTASATGPATGTSTAFNITAGTATQLVFSVQPSSTTAGATITPAVQVTALDASNNTATGFTGNVTVAIGTNPGNGTLAGTATVAASAGVATFANLSINKVGTGYTLTATGAGSATSTAFNITAGTATQLAFTVEPFNTTAGAVITPAVRVTVQDAFGNRVTSFPSGRPNITVAIGNNPGGGTLSGDASNLTGTGASAGIATFNTLSIDKAGEGSTLTASSGSLAGTSTGFNITAGRAAPLVTTVQPTRTDRGRKH